jgi:dephospho-CoA kinase
MIRIGILGDIGSGKSYVAKKFGYPVFNADEEVGELYKKDKKILKKFKKVLPRYFDSLPINKKYVSQAILDNKNNLKKIIKIVHLEIRKKMNLFFKKNKRKKFVILDIPLLLENNINNKNDILVFVQTKKNDVLKKLKMRKNFNKKLMKQFSKIQLPLDYKKKKSHFVIKNDFKRRTVLKYIKNILREIN